MGLRTEAVFEPIEIEKALGWRVFRLADTERAKTVSDNDLREIVQMKSGKRVYVQKAIPELSSHEARLLRSALEQYRGAHSKSFAGPHDAFLEFCKSSNIALDEAQAQYLRRVILCISSQAGVLSAFLEDESLEEIAVIGIGRHRPVHVFDCAFGWLETNIYFSSEEEVRNIVNAMASGIGRRITFQKPRINAVLSDGSRLNACIEPASVSGPCVTIRKFRKKPFTPSDLIKSGTVSAQMMAFLWMAMQADCSLLVCGNTGSGKTTLLNSLFNFVPATERIIIVEETPEVNVPHAHVVRLATAEGIEIGMQELIVNTLRMRPDRVLVGEVRDRSELGALIDTLLAGQGKGSYATFHAQSAADAIARMRNMGTLESDLAALDIILVQRRWSSYSAGAASEERRLVSVCAVEEGSAGALAQDMFSYDFKGKEFISHGISGRVLEKICRAFGIGKKEFQSELCEREEFLRTLEGKGGEEFFAAIQNYGKGDARN